MIKWKKQVQNRCMGKGKVLLAAALLSTQMPALGDHGFPHVEILANGTYFDDVGLTLRNKISGRQTHVVQMSDASDQWVLKITIDPGAVAPWHNHTGTGFLVNVGPGTLTNYVGDDCMPRQITPGQAFIDPGHGDVHAAHNDSGEPVVLIATFLGVSGPPVTPGADPSECGIF